MSINRSKGGVPKLRAESVQVGRLGLEGDKQRNRRFHGGPKRAVCLYSLELVENLRAEGHPIEPGTVGENLTISGLDWAEVIPGAEIVVGGVRLRVTSYTAPCKTIRNSFKDDDFTRISQKLHPGWSRVYCEVVVEGVIRTGDPVTVHLAQPPLL